VIAIIDYGVGNLFSLVSSFKKIGADPVISSDPSVLRSADKLILPGVGAFRDAIEKLKDSGLDSVVYEAVREGKPLMGICLGMQLLFESSMEHGQWQGLGILKGKVMPLEGYIPEELMIPHIGWNALSLRGSSPLLKYVKDGDHVYFVHSYHASECDGSVIATAEYGRDITAAVAQGNVYGCQFHPEKSGEVGLAILRAFLEL
jgi:glutamine amidotransferase